MTMNELEGQVLLLVLVLGEDAVELTDWEVVGLHEEPLPDGVRWAGNEYEDRRN